jgi:hypothetical protein
MGEKVSDQDKSVPLFLYTQPMLGFSFFKRFNRIEIYKP